MNGIPTTDLARHTREFGKAEAQRIPQGIAKRLAKDQKWLLRRLVKRQDTTRESWLHGHTFRTPVICPFDFQTKEKFATFLEGSYDKLATSMGYWIERRTAEAFTKAAQHKIIASHGDIINRVLFPPVAPSEPLSAPLLDRWRRRLCQEGGAVVLSQPRSEDNAPVLDLLCDSITSEGIMPFDPLGVGSVRSGRRAAGFQHLLEEFPARHDLVDGEWKPILPFKEEVGEIFGEILPEYLAAPFQDSLLVLAGTAQILTPYTVTPFATQRPDLLGSESELFMDWAWFSEPGVGGCYLDGTNGYWRCTARLDFEALHPEYMAVIRHRRLEIPSSVYY